jgi:hypothetical protein
MRLYSWRNVGKMGPHARADYNLTLLYLIVDSSLAFHPNYEEKRVGWGRSFFLVGHISICLLISIAYVNREAESTKKGEGRWWELTLSLKRHFMENGQPHA